MWDAAAFAYTLRRSEWSIMPEQIPNIAQQISALAAKILK